MNTFGVFSHIFSYIAISPVFLLLFEAAVFHIDHFYLSSTPVFIIDSDRNSPSKDMDYAIYEPKKAGIPEFVYVVRF